MPIATNEQRHQLEEAKNLAPRHDSALIPAEKTYVQQSNSYDYQAKLTGLRNPHGLRHAYAQKRYKELTGWEPPINSGPATKDLNPAQKEIDHNARITISEELGIAVKILPIPILAANQFIPSHSP